MKPRQDMLKSATVRAEQLGYDGVNNGNEEYIAFNSNQIKRVDNNAPTENEDVRYSEKRDGTIKKLLEENSDKLNTMEPVYSASVPESVGHRLSVKEKWMREQLKRFGKSVDRKDFGKVDLSDKKIADAAKYLDKDPEVVATVCVPYVIKRGIEINHHTEHKGRETVESFTFAAPVVLNDVRGNMAVVVQKNK